MSFRACTHRCRRAWTWPGIALCMCSLLHAFQLSYSAQLCSSRYHTCYFSSSHINFCLCALIPFTETPALSLMATSSSSTAIPAATGASITTTIPAASISTTLTATVGNISRLQLHLHLGSPRLSHHFPDKLTWIDHLTVTCSLAIHSLFGSATLVSFDHWYHHNYYGPHWIHPFILVSFSEWVTHNTALAHTCMPILRQLQPPTPYACIIICIKKKHSAAAAAAVAAVVAVASASHQCLASISYYSPGIGSLGIAAGIISAQGCRTKSRKHNTNPELGSGCQCKCMELYQQ